MMRRLPALTVVLTLSLCLAAVPSALSAEEKFELSFGPGGPEQLLWAGGNILGKSGPQLRRVVLERQTLNEDGLQRVTFEPADLTNPHITFDAAQRRITHAFDWGSVDFAYKAQDGQLHITATLHNRSDRTLAGFDLMPLQLVRPAEGEKADAGTHAVMPGDLNIVEIPFGNGKFLFCAEAVMPLRFGFDLSGNDKRTLSLNVSGSVNILPPGGVTYHALGLPRIAPGESLTLPFSLRPVPADAELFDAAEDAVATYRAHHQPRQVWPDRRPIGTIFIGKGFGPEHNPRNWFGDAKLDVRTDAGRAELRARMMKEAGQSIRVLQDVNAQGMILWDPEGAENPHPITYIGDPRMVEIVAPEMADIYAEYFEKFHRAGLRTGVCIRPTQVYLTPFTHALDGNPDTRWSVRTFPQWITIDLGSEKRINRTQLITHSDRAYQFMVEAGTEPNALSVILDRRDNEQGGSTENPITDRFEPVTARYLKLTVTGAHGYDGEWCSINEFQVFSEGGENVALNRGTDTSRSFGRAVGGHGTGAHDPGRNPLNDDFSEIWPENVPAEHFHPVVERMSRKITFAKENWGCTLFYIDTNGVHRRDGMNQSMEWTLLGPYVWRELQERHPDVLLIPEFSPNPGQLAYTSSYLQPPYSSAVLPEATRQMLPGAFAVTQTVNLSREAWQALRDQLVEGVAAGDSMFFRGWFSCSYNPLIKAVYEEAAQSAPFHVSVRPDGIQANGQPLADADALRRWLRGQLPRTLEARPRRVVLSYHPDIPLPEREKLEQAVFDANGILAWTRTEESLQDN